MRRVQRRLHLLVLLLLPLLASCGRDGTNDSNDESTGTVAQSLIQDSLHNGGTKNFYWLPPLVSKPNPTGVFDASQSPIVKVDELGSTGQTARTVATFTATTGRGAARIRVTGRAYRVKWDTDDARLDPNKAYRIRVLLGTTELGVADIDVVSKPAEIKNVDRSAYVPLLNGTVLAIRFSI